VPVKEFLENTLGGVSEHPNGRKGRLDLSPLDQVPVGPGAVRGFCLQREHGHLDPIAARHTLHPPADLPPVQLGKNGIQQDEIGPSHSSLIERIHSGARGQDSAPFCLQQLRHGPQPDRITIRDEDRRSRIHAAPSRMPAVRTVRRNTARDRAMTSRTLHGFTM